MSLINGSLQIGRSALVAQQAAMQVIGNNVANAGDPNYTRQTARLAPVRGIKLPDGSDPGAGVQMMELQRHIDYALEQRLRQATSAVNYDDVVGQSLSKLEALYNEMTDSDLSSSLSEFFNAWSQLQSQPHDVSTRHVVTQVAEALTDQIRMLRGDVVSAYNDLGQQLDEAVDRVNYLTGRLAQLNVDIANASAAGKSPSALLDQRDGMLKELSQLIDVNVVDHDPGDVTIYLGAEPLVQYNSSRDLKVDREGNGELIVPHLVFADSGRQADTTQGKVGAITYLIDDFVTRNLQQLDTLSAALIFEVNKIHSAGQGLNGYRSLTSEYAVEDPAAALNAAGLAFNPENGTFIISVLDSNTGQRTAHQINVDLNGLGTDTTLNDLVAQINAVAGLNASVLPDGRFQISTTSSNYTFTFSEDSSCALAALGVNSFFTGQTAADIRVRTEIAADPTLIAASRNNLPGDGSNAELISSLRSASVDALAGISIPDYYRAVISELGTRTASAQHSFEVHSAVVDTLQSQREAISGVNLDEEAVDLMVSQRAFQGAAQFVTIINQLVQEVLNLI